MEVTNREIEMTTKTCWTADQGWHEIESGSADDVHVCKQCAAVGRFQWTPNRAPTCRNGHAQPRSTDDVVCGTCGGWAIRRGSIDLAFKDDPDTFYCVACHVSIVGTRWPVA